MKFIKNVLAGEPDISDELVEVLSFSFMNIKYLSCKYPARIMSMVKKYDPDNNATDVRFTFFANFSFLYNKYTQNKTQAMKIVYYLYKRERKTQTNL